MDPSVKQFAKDLAYEAGKIMRDNFGTGFEREWKEDKSPVTITDKTINDLVLSKVKNTYPEHSILAEEGSYLVPGSCFTWVCDPVDGTVPYSCAMPTATFSLALVKDGKSVLGVIYDPFSDRLYAASAGKGATLNGKPIKVNSKDSLERAYINIESQKLVPLMPVLNELGAKTQRLYCITYPGVLVSCGEYDAVIAGKAKAWDVAALKVIVEEAGGKVTGIDGNEQRYDQEELNGLIVSNGGIHDILKYQLAQRFTRY